jgi:ComF family protein
MGAGIHNVIRRAGRGLLDLAFPPVCLICRGPVASADSLCPACWNTLQFIDGPVCDCCGLPFDIDAGPGTRCGSCLATPPAFDRGRAVLRYDEAGKAPLLALKHADRLDLVPAFAAWLDRAGAELLQNADLIVPVPLHAIRLWRRRYNQAAELARALARRRKLGYAAMVLQRVKNTPSQGTMPSAAARRRNMRGAFWVPRGKREAIKGKHLVLVDDVLTTGATASSAARILKRAGAASVSILAVARVVRPG